MTRMCNKKVNKSAIACLFIIRSLVISLIRKNKQRAGKTNIVVDGGAAAVKWKRS